MPLNIDWQQILLHLLNFVILAGGLYFLLYKPVKGFMEKRVEHYKSLDDEAETKLANAKKLESDYQARMDSAGDEIRDQKAAAVKEAESAAEAMLEGAKKQKAQMLADAAAAAEREKTKAVEESREEIAELAVAAAEKLLHSGSAADKEASPESEA